MKTIIIWQWVATLSLVHPSILANSATVIAEEDDWDTLASENEARDFDGTGEMYSYLLPVQQKTTTTSYCQLLPIFSGSYFFSTFCTLIVLCYVVVVVVVSHIQRIGCQPEKTTLHGGQSRSWSAEQGKENKRKSLAASC